MTRGQVVGNRRSAGALTRIAHRPAARGWGADNARRWECRPPSSWAMTASRLEHHDGELGPETLSRSGRTVTGATCAAGKLGQQLLVARADLDALGDFPIETLQLAQHHGALQRVHAAAHADAGVVVAARLAVHAISRMACASSSSLVNSAAVAVAASGLLGKKLVQPMVDRLQLLRPL